MIRDITLEERLKRVRSFVASHGHEAWIEGDMVHFTTHACQHVRTSEGWVALPDSWHEVLSTVSTVSEARAALGY